MARPERRKIRKGTKSCWECKRRKTRCTFTAAPSSDSCDGCRRRGQQCLSQEQPEPGHLASGSHRLNRIEVLLEQLLERQPLRVQESQSDSLHTNDSAGTDIQTSPNRLHVPLSASTRTRNSNQPHEFILQHPIPHLPLTRTPSPIFVSPSTLVSSAKHDQIRARLLGAWPGLPDLNIILQVPFALNECEHALLPPFSEASLGEFGSRGSPLLRMIAPPSSNAHPIIFAQRLLTLAFLLKAVITTKPSALDNLSIGACDLIARIMEVVRTQVNCVDEMVRSVEGVECIALESMYYHHGGDLMQSWITLRRAMTIAQAMGLHRRVHSASLTLRSETLRQLSKSRHVWHNLVHSDRYLSLTLSLPQCSSASPFATPAELDACEPEERLKRLDCASLSRILQQKESASRSIAETMEIDRMLQDGANGMPSRWWLLAAPSSDGTKSARMLEQIRHYHVISQLHWPSLLSGRFNEKHEYGRIAATNASREVLMRCMALHNSGNIGCCWAAINNLAFIASTALCLAYLELRNSICSDSHAASLAHLRPGDRAMMERVLESMETMYSATPVESSGILSNLRQLLAVEEDAARGTRYVVKSLERDSAYEAGDEMRNDIDTLHLDIPSIGATISIQRADDWPEMDSTLFIEDHAGVFGADIARDEGLLNCPLSFDVAGALTSNLQLT